MHPPRCLEKEKTTGTKEREDAYNLKTMKPKTTTKSVKDFFLKTGQGQQQRIYMKIKSIQKI